MMDADNILKQISEYTALWCPAVGEETDLAAMAQYAIAQKNTIISAAPDSVAKLWPWLEGSGVAIYARFYLNGDKNGTYEERISDLTARINTVFKQGASGAQVFVKLSDLELFVSQLHVIRDDLFFNKTLTIGLDINDIGPYDWADLFGNLKKIQAASLLLAMPRDTGDKSDFVGRLYGAMDMWDTEFRGDLHFALGQNFIRIDQAFRLVQEMRPKLQNGLKFFISNA